MKTAATPPPITYSCYRSEYTKSEHFVEDHVLGHVVSGTMEFQLAGHKVTCQEGDYYFVGRNQFTKAAKNLGADGEFRSISVRLSQETLRQFSMAHPNTAAAKSHSIPTIQVLPSNAMLKGYFDSLGFYEEGTASEALIHLKIEEGILLLLHLDTDMHNLLFDFSQPGKIDLEEFMQHNFRFNVHLDRFAYLSGRSLATFKRDFQKVFHTTPNKWLQKKRLEEAHYLLQEKKMKPKEVYLEVGFEDLSHFSFAFKKAYGTGPSRV